MTGDVALASDTTDTVEIYSPTGTFVRRFGDTGPNCGGNVSAIGGVAVADDGRVYVSDRGGDCISVFSEAGAFVDTFGTPGAGPTEVQTCVPSARLTVHRSRRFVAPLSRPKLTTPASCSTVTVSAVPAPTSNSFSARALPSP